MKHYIPIAIATIGVLALCAVANTHVCNCFRCSKTVIRVNDRDNTAASLSKQQMLPLQTK